MIKILSFLKDYKKQCILGPLFKLLEACFELLVPLIVAKVIDSAIPNNNGNQVIYYSLILIVLGIVGFLCAIIAQYYAAKASCGFAKNLKRSLFAHIQTLSHSEYDKLGTATMITRLTSDANQLQTGVNMAVRLFLRSPFVVFGAMIMAFTIDVECALIFVVTIPLLAIVVFAIILGCIPLYKKVQGKLEKVVSKTRENLNGVRVIRSFRLENSEKQQFDSANNQLLKSQRFVGLISSLTNPITYVILNFAIIALISKGAIRVELGLISQGAVIALYNYMSQILIELVKLANLIVTITKSVACGKRVEKVFEIKNSIIGGKQTTATLNENAVQFKNVSLKYQNASENSVTDITFTAKIGQKIGIIGATGSGKSSFINLIARFYDATSGEINIFDKDIKSYDLKTLRSYVCVTMQKSVLFKGTVRDNIKWGNENATDEEIWNSLQIANAKEFVIQKGGLDSQVEQGGSNFSGGQKQRLAIARSIVSNSKILVLDDSFSALDFETEYSLRAAINNLDSQKTIFIVSQRVSTIMGSDLIIVLDDGKMVGMGTHNQLMQDCLIYREICHSQLGGGENE